jgi:hypothetical protein
VRVDGLLVHRFHTTIHLGLHALDNHTLTLSTRISRRGMTLSPNPLLYCIQAYHMRSWSKVSASLPAVHTLLLSSLHKIGAENVSLPTKICRSSVPPLASKCSPFGFQVVTPRLGVVIAESRQSSVEDSPLGESEVDGPG